MKLDEKQFSQAVSVISNDINRFVMLSLYKDNVKKYSEIKSIIQNYRGWKDMRSSKAGYYIRQLYKNKIIRKNDELGWYYLTRFGIQLCELIDGIQEICMKYDMDDVGADGKIMVRIQR